MAKSKSITPVAKKAPAKTKAVMQPAAVNAKTFTERLYALQSDEELKKLKGYFKTGEGEYGEGDVFIGIKMGNLFALAEEFIAMPVKEIEKLLESPVHELRAGAMSIMDKQGRNKKTTDENRKELYDLYLRRHDRINNWDLVDLAAIHVVGRYLADKPRAILYKLAKSKNMWERRTAIVATGYFLMKQKDVEDTFKIGEMLVKDKEDLIHKAAGGWVRHAGNTDRKRLLQFLDTYAETLPRTYLRYAVEKLDKKQKEYYMGLKNK